MATFGPLYKAVGGDHLGRLRGGLAHAYNHLLLDPDEYANFVDHMTVEGVDVVEGAFTGSRQYIELDLFSHASWGDYLELFRRMLDLEVFTVHVDPESIEFRDRFPGKWAAIIDRGYAEEDLLASSITVVGRFRH